MCLANLDYLRTPIKMNLMDSDKVKRNLRGESDRETMSIYLSRTVVGEFKDVLADIDPSGKLTFSRLLEEVMKEFVDNYSGQKRPKAKKIKKS